MLPAVVAGGVVVLVVVVVVVVVVVGVPLLAVTSEAVYDNINITLVISTLH